MTKETLQKACQLTSDIRDAENLKQQITGRVYAITEVGYVGWGKIPFKKEHLDQLIAGATENLDAKIIAAQAELDAL